MSLNEKFWKLHRQRDWVALHDALDAASPGCDAEERCCITHWRAAARAAVDRCLEAVDFLIANRSDFFCGTLASTRIAENLHRLGRDMDAIEELKKAPMANECQRYWALVTDAKYVLVHLLASNGLEVDKAILDAIPDGYIHITDRGQRISKSDLMGLISRGKRGSIASPR
jgi:hypothetical protein